MKKQFIVIISACCLALPAIAQIPNNGFENWTSMGSYSNPDNWDQLNGTTTTAGVYTCTKGTPGNVGSSYLKLTSKTVTGMGVIPGIATNGTLNIGSMKVQGGSPYTTRSAAFTGNWQYMGYSGDVGSILVFLTKWNTSTMKRDTIANGSQQLTGMVMSWATFSISLNYKSTANPDTVQIILSASGTTPANNSYLYVDNLGFSGVVPGTATGITNMENYTGTISVYPNPATDYISVEMNLQKSANIILQLIDCSGKLIKEINTTDAKGNYKNTLNTTGLAKGTYFLKVQANEAKEIKKIIIN